LKLQTVNERIAILVENSKLSKTEFGKRINVTPAYISKLVRTGTPSDSTIADICRVYNVNEQWLRTGDGEMYTPMARDTEISEFFGDLMKGVEPTFKRRFVAALTRLDESQWEILEKLCQEMMDEEKEKGPPE
jgi:transcriptional regulator with XRE-family HTH domain